MNLCSFGICSDNPQHRCPKPAIWESTFNGRGTGACWCDEHKIEGDPVSGHGVRPICLFCHIYPAALSDSYHDAIGAAGYCSTCRSAHGLIHTSVDDARQSIKNATKEVCESALAQMTNNSRVTLRKMIQARLKRLAKQSPSPSADRTFDKNKNKNLKA